MDRDRYMVILVGYGVGQKMQKLIQFFWDKMLNWCAEQMGSLENSSRLAAKFHRAVQSRR